jgi:hypothetical protein
MTHPDVDYFASEPASWLTNPGQSFARAKARLHDTNGLWYPRRAEGLVGPCASQGASLALPDYNPCSA